MVRCLESILKQDYKLVEVIISDDSPNENIKQAIMPYIDNLNIKYFHNKPALQSPKNWNAAMDKATGDLMVLLHQDDWFFANDALSTYVRSFNRENVDFVFCQNTAIDENGNKIILQGLPALLKEMAIKPNHLLLSQVIGPPSNTMLKKTVSVRYDESFIWLVDVDYYSRILKAGYKYAYIEKHLVSIGLHEDQTTVFVQNNKDIIFKENIWFAKKIGDNAFTDVRIYDYYWRLLRNHKVRSLSDIKANNVEADDVSPVINHMFNIQRKIPLSILNIGIFSKSLMSINYLMWKMRNL